MSGLLLDLWQSNVCFCLFGAGHLANRSAQRCDWCFLLFAPFSVHRYWTLALLLTRDHQPIYKLILQCQVSNPFSRKFSSDCSISKAKFSQSLDPYFVLVWYFPHNQIIKIITVTSNYVKFIKIYVLYLHDNRNKNYDVTLTLQASWNSGTRAKSQMFTYEIHSWSLHFCHFGTQSNK